MPAAGGLPTYAHSLAVTGRTRRAHTLAHACNLLRECAMALRASPTPSTPNTITRAPKVLSAHTCAAGAAPTSAGAYRLAQAKLPRAAAAGPAAAEACTQPRDPALRHPDPKPSSLYKIEPSPPPSNTTAPTALHPPPNLLTPHNHSCLAMRTLTPNAQHPTSPQ